MKFITRYKLQMLFCAVFILSVSANKAENVTNATKDYTNPTIKEISSNLIDIILRSDANISTLNVLNDKLQEIERYVVDRSKLEELLTNLTKESNLTETNFYKSMFDEDHFTLKTQNQSQNLYLKLKSKMNRDDILNILSERTVDAKLNISARKAMNDDNFLVEDEEVDDVVDKLIGELPNDVHQFDASVNDSIYWDPQGELEDLKEYHRHDGRRLYKGERTTVRYYPFMVSVHVMGRFWCGGVIYWHDLVLTSAACLQLMHNNRFFREKPKVLTVRVGSNHSRIGGEMIDALEVFFHPAYNPKTLNHNIAVIRLRRHLYFNYHRIPKVIAISHNDMGVPDTAEVLLLGWGVTKITQTMSYEPIFLQRKFLPVYPNYVCKEAYGEKFITSTMFCAGTFTTGEGACDHDAGGPAILGGKLVGIISFGPAICGYPNAPTVFTLVGAYADWIETINETMPGYYRGKKRTTTTEQPYLWDMLDSWSKTSQATKIRPWRGDFSTTDSTTLTTVPDIDTSGITTPKTFLLRHISDDDDEVDRVDMDSNKK